MAAKGRHGRGRLLGLEPAGEDARRLLDHGGRVRRRVFGKDRQSAGGRDQSRRRFHALGPRAHSDRARPRHVGRVGRHRRRPARAEPRPLGRSGAGARRRERRLRPHLDALRAGQPADGDLETGGRRAQHGPALPRLHDDGRQREAPLAVDDRGQPFGRGRVQQSVHDPARGVSGGPGRIDAGRRAVVSVRRRARGETPRRLLEQRGPARQPQQRRAGDRPAGGAAGGMSGWGEMPLVSLSVARRAKPRLQFLSPNPRARGLGAELSGAIAQSWVPHGVHRQVWRRRRGPATRAVGGCGVMCDAPTMKQPWPNCGEETSC
jgi:hypothetical protein